MAADLLAACGSSGSSKASAPSQQPGPSSVGTPVHGGKLTVAVVSAGASETVDVRKTTYTPDLVRAAGLYDCLYAQAPGGVAPQLAVSAEPNKDATVWRFRLRDGVTFHNGKSFSADDVVYTIQESWNSPASFYQPLTAALIDVKNVRKLDRLTVEVPLLRPFAQFPSISAWQNCGIVPAGQTDVNKPVGTGPFKFGTFTAGSGSSFPANPDYWDGGPYVDELVVDSSFTDDPARLDAVLSKQADIAPGAPPALVKANAGSSTLVIGNSVGPQFAAVVLRVDRAPFNDTRVVQALKLMTDREAIVSDAFDGYATVGNDCPCPTLQYWASSIKPVYDPERAKSLLKAAGASSLSMPVVTAPYLPGLVEAITLWSAQAASIGLNFPVKQIPVGELFASSAGYMTNSRPLGSTEWNSVPSSLSSFYVNALSPHGEYTETGWGLQPAQNLLLEQALPETDPAKAETKWYAVQEQQVAQGGYVIPANVNYLDVYAAAVRGAETTSAADSCNNFAFHKTWIAS